MRYVIIGGGIVGLATARRLLLDEPDAEVTVLEKERALASHQTGRNSGVVHAGLYYEPGSLKARLCLRGGALLREYCAEKGIAYEECGKVVVALEESEMRRLRALTERAVANGVPDLRIVDQAELKRIEPHVEGIAALHSPHTAIVDYGAVARFFADDVRAAGGTVRLGIGAATVRPSATRPEVRLEDGTLLEADRVLVAAGLQTDRLAEAAGQPRDPRIVPFRGEYWKLRPKRESLVNGLIYPVPDPALPFLGVHLTKKVNGEVWVGPNAVLAFAREGYSNRDVDWRDLRDVLSSPGMRVLARQHWRTGAAEIGRSLSRRRFIAEARRYVPELRADDVVHAPAGVRAQALDADGTLVDDFRLGQADSVTWVRNAPSPAATSSMAIAEELRDRLIADRTQVTHG